MRRRILFVGVTTGQSSIMRVFPLWADALDVDVGMEGVDLPLGAPRERYVAVVERIRDDPTVLGAVITTHKLNLFEACERLFTRVDTYAALCREVSAISRDEGQLSAHATDPISSIRTLDAMLGPEYWSGHHADVLCLGAGGAATAIALSVLGSHHLGTESSSTRTYPRRFIAVDSQPERVETFGALIQSLSPDTEIILQSHGEPARNDALLRELAPASLVINATGMGKDRPGSPITDSATFPHGGIVWDLNYRGALHFLTQARKQALARRLQIHDGWLYFLHGWTQALSPVLQMDLTGHVFDSLVSLAGPARH